MFKNLYQKVIDYFRKIVNSIAFYPALIALFFLFLSYLMISIDFSDSGKQIKSNVEWLRLQDASTARTIVSVIAGGILSLTVFSFTMVMVILNQAASQMSNRVLDKLIGNRFQQIVLGFYIGTIVYSLFLLSSIRDIDSGIYVPALSTYLLITFAIIDIFLFIYFLHYITQSVKYAVIINRIKKQTQKALEATCRLSQEPVSQLQKEGFVLTSRKSGMYEGFNKDRLARLAQKEDIVISFIYAPGSYILKDAPLLFIDKKESLSNDIIGEILLNIYIDMEESIDKNFYYGFRQLTEVAIKALSPGINDPGTAIQSLRAINQLLSYRLIYFPDNIIKDEKGIIRIITQEKSFEQIFNATVLPVWDYGKNDRFIQDEMQHLLLQLQSIKDHPSIKQLLIKINQQQAKIAQ